MLLETPEFTAVARSARMDAYRDMKLAAREARTTVRGQIRIEPRRTTREAEAAELDRPKATGQIIRGAKRQHVVARLAETLNQSRRTPFEFEGSCRHGVRAELCLEGHEWHAADREAASLLAESLGRLRARRPTYDEGQREYSVSPDYCAWCGSPLEDGEHKGRHQSYCSEVCAKAALVHREINHHRRETRAFHAAWDVILRSKNPARECDDCGKPFRPRFPGETFCSPSCSHHHAVVAAGKTFMGHELLQPRTCPTCKTTFQPRKSDQVHCSPECGFLARRTVPERACEHCGTTFRPKSNRDTNRFCSRACHYAHGPEAKYARECDWCGAPFMAKLPHARVCSEACRIADRKLALGTPPTFLAAHVFDHFISVPALAAMAGGADG